MADHKILAPIIRKWEGGFANDPDDPGGATMAGITLATFTYYRKLKKLPIPTVEDLKNISDEEWDDVFKTLFWDKWEADLINNQSIANIVVDWEWASGCWGIKVPQELMHLHPDGVVGSRTIAEINSEDQQMLFYEIQHGREQFAKNVVVRNPKEQKFLNGWINRIDYFKFEA